VLKEIPDDMEGTVKDNAYEVQSSLNLQ